MLTTTCNPAEIEPAVEAVLAKQLLHERMRTLPNEPDREAYEQALDAFEDWADQYGLPTTPHVMAAYLLELHKVYGACITALRHIADAYYMQHDRDVHIPIRAALNFCSSCQAASPRATA